MLAVLKKMAAINNINLPSLVFNCLSAVIITSLLATLLKNDDL
jgi:hypothetical protein